MARRYHPKDVHDDAFYAYVGDLVEKAVGLERALTYIKEHLGGVCDAFETCGHRSCRDSCTAWLIAEAALSGDYRLPGEEVLSPSAKGSSDDGVPLPE